ncbi:MAG: cytochrome P450, partial [Sphingomonadaceae bacterium]|nr:cytochrome P450 [Sphingomonadaceae bacterium]
FLGGQDTVASMMGFSMWRLAERPELQHRLKEDPAIVPAAVEELLRRHGLSITARLIMEDIERKGASLKADDMILVVNPLSGVDPRTCENPLTVDFDRGPVAHNSMGNGPHKCVGQHLARMEMQIFLEEWSQRMPVVSLDTDAPPPSSHSGGVIGLNRLNLRWDT